MSMSWQLIPRVWGGLGCHPQMEHVGTAEHEICWGVLLFGKLEYTTALRDFKDATFLDQRRINSVQLKGGDIFLSL